MGLATRAFQSAGFVLQLSDALLIQPNGAEKTMLDIANLDPPHRHCLLGECLGPNFHLLELEMTEVNKILG